MLFFIDIYLHDLIFPFTYLVEENNGDQHSSETAAEDSSNDVDSNTQSRFYVALDKEQRKGKPNKAVINRYLNLEFESRSCLLESTKRELRVSKILELYPCFKDPVEVCFSKYFAAKVRV